jgi:hypothetical protein
MRKAIPLRLDHDAVGLRGLARASEDADQVRRLLALALIYDGGSRTQAAAAAGVTLQVVCDWVLRFNAHGPGGLIDRTAPGQPSRLIPAVHGVIRWRIIDLSANGSGRNTGSASQSRCSAASCGPSDTASCRRAHAITRRRRAPSITAAMPGTNSRPSHGPSCPSDCVIGAMGPDQRVLVLSRLTAKSPTASPRTTEDHDIAATCRAGLRLKSRNFSPLEMSPRAQ